mgnify:CR=1 FL=1
MELTVLWALRRILRRLDSVSVLEISGGRYLPPDKYENFMRWLEEEIREAQGERHD